MASSSVSTPQRIAIVGAGAIGGHFAARLAAAGHTVSLLARGATLATLRSHGLRYTTGAEAQRSLSVRACATAEEMGPQDLVVLALKSQALPALVASLQPLLADGTPVLPVGNGLPWWYFLVPDCPLSGLQLRSVDPQGDIARAIALDQVLGGTVMASCHCPAPGVVVHSAGGRVVVGEARGGPSARVDHWVQVLADAGLGAAASSNIRADLWHKLLGNVCANPLSLLTCATTDRMLDDPGVHALFAHTMQECIALGQRLGLPITTTAAQRIAQTRQLGAIKSSMLQDLEAGRGVELDAILGATLECAQALEQPMPYLQSIHALACLRAREAGLWP